MYVVSWFCSLDDESFLSASALLVNWMERGDCSHRNANTFYTMIQSVNSHVRRLVSEKSQHDEQLELMKLQFKQQLENILRQCKYPLCMLWH